MSTDLGKQVGIVNLYYVLTESLVVFEPTPECRTVYPSSDPREYIAEAIDRHLFIGRSIGARSMGNTTLPRLMASMRYSLAVLLASELVARPHYRQVLQEPDRIWIYNTMV